MDALQTLATSAQAQGGNRHAFFRIKQQVLECHELGLGERLVDWMAESESAGFLAPFIRALHPCGRGGEIARSASGKPADGRLNCASGAFAAREKVTSGGWIVPPVVHC
jgi:hypothetical protein